MNENGTKAPATETAHAEFSPSSFERRYNCPASYIMEQGQPQIASAIADEGTKIHAQVADLIRGTLSEEDADLLANRCFWRFAGVAESYASPAVYVEKRLESKVGGTANFGTADCLVVGGGEAVLFDWKTGYNKVAKPSMNWQIKWYCLFVFDNFPEVEAVHAIIYNPRIFQDETAHFTRSSVEQLRNELAEVIAICKAGSPVPKVGEWCDYCRGKGKCPAVRNAIATLQESTALCDLDDDGITALYEKVDAVKGLCEKIAEEMKMRLRQNGKINGYSIRTISGATEITDTAEMLNRIAGTLTPAEIASTAKYSVTAIADAIYNKKKAVGEKVTKSSAKATLLEMLDGCTSKKPDTERIIKDK